MRITFILPEMSLSGGVRVVATYSKLLRERGHKITIVHTPAKPENLRDHIRRWLLGNRAQQWKQGGSAFFVGAEAELKMIDGWRPIVDADVPDSDVVVATWWETAEWVQRLAPRKGAKAYFIQHYETWGGDPERVSATWRLPLHKIVISRWLAELAREKFGDPDYSVVPNGVDLEQFKTEPRQKCEIPTVGLMYSHTAFKACETGLKAIELMRKKIPNLRVKSFGVDLPKPELPLPAGAEFTHRPAQAAIPGIYAGCDVWLFTSRSEGFGLPLLEAMACRTPVVGTTAGAAPELLERGGGVLVPIDDPGAMASAAINVLCSSDDQWLSRSTRAYGMAMQHSWNNSALKMEEALVRAAEKHGTVRPPVSEVESFEKPGKNVPGDGTFGDAVEISKTLETR